MFAMIRQTAAGMHAKAAFTPLFSLKAQAATMNVAIPVNTVNAEHIFLLIYIPPSTTTQTKYLS